MKFGDISPVSAPGSARFSGCLEMMVIKSFGWFERAGFLVNIFGAK